MYYSYIEIEYVATSFSPTRTDLALTLLIAASNHIENENKMTEHTDALKILLLQLLLE